MSDTSDEVLRDLLRARGLTEEQIDDVEMWARAPGAVRELISHDPQVVVGDYETVCPGCDVGYVGPDFGYRESHQRDCRVAAAWRELGDPRADEDLKKAEMEARSDEVMRSGGRGRYGPVWYVGNEIGPALAVMARGQFFLSEEDQRAFDAALLPRDNDLT